MEMYSTMRAFADSWGLLAMMAFFVGAIVILFRPGASALHKEASEIPLRDEPCQKDCETCHCSELEFSVEQEK